jgi:polyisoprenoid-binding protein YceI
MYNAFAQDTNKTNLESNISFHIRSFGIDVDGSFQESAIQLEMDSLSVSPAYLKVKIPVSSIETGISKRDRHLLEEKYFWQSKYPYMLFETSSIKNSGDDAYVAVGQVNIKGVLKTMSIPFQMISGEKETVVHADFDLNRLDFDIGGKSWTMSETVKITVSFSFKN